MNFPSVVAPSHSSVLVLVSMRQGLPWRSSMTQRLLGLRLNTLRPSITTKNEPNGCQDAIATRNAQPENGTDPQAVATITLWAVGGCGCNSAF